MRRLKLLPLAGLLAGLALTASFAQPAFAQLFATYSSSVIVGGSTGKPLFPPNPGNFIVTARLPTGAPAPGVLVELDFTPAFPQIRLIDHQNAGTTVQCPPRTLSQLTNAAGQAIFNPRFSGWNNANTVVVRLNGVAMAAFPARSTAMSTTSAATDLAALALFAARYGGFFQEADFDVSGGPVGLSDFGIFAAEYTRPQPAQGFCP
jgi:hypothetical protein